MMYHRKPAVNRQSGLVKWPWLLGVLGLVFVRAALATDPLYENDSVLTYTVPPQNMPAIDATNFLNNNSFQINFTSTKGGQNIETFESENTVNYTNNGTMVATSPILVSGSLLILSLSPGCGFNFDTFNTQSGLEQMAGNFYNPGNIRANSFVDLQNNFFLVSTIGKCLVNASNIINPGTIDLGANSLAQLTGKNVDLTRGTLTLEDIPSIFGSFAAVGTDTNGDWIPSEDLQPTAALSSSPVFLFLASSTPYFQVTVQGSNSTVVRAIFLQDQLTNNITSKVFWAGSPFGGGGLFNIEWDGTYVDPVSGNTTTEYLYLNDDDVLGSLNPPIINGIPINFTFFEGNQELFFGPSAPAGYQAGVFQPFGAVVTNTYSYVDAQLIPTSVATNNPTTQQNVTNYLSQVLPGRIQISADSNLDLSLSQISGQNYLSLRAPVQFNGSAGAHIFSPYSDINLGVTNGFLTLTNLMEPFVPVWNGSVQAWSARWISFTTNFNIGVDTNGLATTNFFAVTNDYRVLLVSSSLLPTTSSEIQDLGLHGTNSLVVSDVFNVLRSFTTDARNLTLTTNGPGSTSSDGELNLAGPIVWPSATPNLRNVTNSGAIRIYNLNSVNFGTSASPYGAFINHGIVADLGSIIYATNFESDGIFSNAVLGSFILNSQTATLTNGSLFAGGDVSITTGSLLASNVFLQANRSLTLTVTNLLTDTGPSPTNANFWSVGATNIGNGSGFCLPIKPVVGDLLGTTVTNYAPANRKIVNLWAGQDRGTSNAGYTNNVAVGHLVLDALGQAPGTWFTNISVGASNAIYVDRLELRGYASYTNHDSGGNIPTLAFNTNLLNNNNLVIYYADAIADGAGDVSELINHKNHDHLRWVPTYVGYFSSTNLVFLGTTNTFNIALAQSHDIDSDGDGVVNASDPTPFFLPSMLNFVDYVTNNPANTIVVSWNTIPLATNFVYYSTNMVGPYNQLLTNFISPQPRPNPATNVMVFDPMVSPPRYYQVVVSPWLTWPY